MDAMFTDIHHHILWGLDDGPDTYEKMTRMLDAAAADGTRLIIATPHAAPGIEPFDLDTYRAALEQANAYCRCAGLPLEVRGGAEVFYTQSAVRMLRTGQIPTLADSGYVLVEWGENETEAAVADAIIRLQGEGFIPVMAHVERLRCFLRNPARLIALRASCVIRLQVNCGAVLRGPLTREYRFVRRLCREGMLDFVASDAHNVTGRPTRMRLAHEKLTQLCGQAGADALMVLNPAEIVMHKR